MLLGEATMLLEIDVKYSGCDRNNVESNSLFACLLYRMAKVHLEFKVNFVFFFFYTMLFTSHVGIGNFTERCRRKTVCVVTLP